MFSLFLLFFYQHGIITIKIKHIFFLIRVQLNLKPCFSISVFLKDIYLSDVSNFIYLDILICLMCLFIFLVDISNDAIQPVPVRNESKRRRWLLLLLLLLLLASSGVLTGILLHGSKKYGL